MNRPAPTTAGTGSRRAQTQSPPTAGTGAGDGCGDQIRFPTDLNPPGDHQHPGETESRLPRHPRAPDDEHGGVQVIRSTRRPGIRRLAESQESDRSDWPGRTPEGGWPNARIAALRDPVPTPADVP